MRRNYEASDKRAGRGATTIFWAWPPMGRKGGMPAPHRRAIRYRATGTNRPRPGPARRPRPSGAPITSRGAAAGIGHAAGQVFLAFGFLVIGFYLGFFITALLPETLVERRTRLRVAEELRLHGSAPEA